jgi:hypothetical protein
MSAATMIAIHAAASAAARTKVLDAFRLNDATSPARARPLAELGLSGDEPPLRELIERGVIRAIDSRGRSAVIGDSTGRIAGLYLDERAYVEMRDAKRKPGRGAVLIVAGLLALAVGLGVALVTG